MSRINSLKDLVNVSNKFKYVLFVDGTNITVNKELDKIHGWLWTNIQKVQIIIQLIILSF